MLCLYPFFRFEILWNFLIFRNMETLSLFVTISPWWNFSLVPILMLLSWWLSGKEPVCNAGDTGDVGLIPGSGRSLGRGNGNPLQYSCLENPMNRGTRWATIHILQSSMCLSMHACNLTFSDLHTGKRKKNTYLSVSKTPF